MKDQGSEKGLGGDEGGGWGGGVGSRRKPSRENAAGPEPNLTHVVPGVPASPGKVCAHLSLSLKTYETRS